MIDYSSQWLIQRIQLITQTAQSKNIWCCDENVLHQFSNMPTSDGITHSDQWTNKPKFISNRWDIAEQATRLGFDSHFNDFDLTEIADNSSDNFFYRISKEKAVTHHLINEAFRILKPQGTLWLSGQKNEGIKTYIEKACTLFGYERSIQKDGASYSSQIKKLSSENPYLNDENYSQLRECLNIDEKTIFSKPGQFGWNKIDQGSEFLISEASKQLAHSPKTLDSCLDLGCGYGYLSIASQQLQIKKRVLTDNNAAALISARQNCDMLKIDAEIIPSDAGQQINQQFDLILCNPPFHQGFSVDGDLTDKFLINTKKLLAKHGTAYFVVNQFIPLEKKASSLFKTVTTLAQNKSFKIIAVSHN